MLRWSIIFFVIAMIAALFGFTEIASGASSIAQMLFFFFVVLFFITLLISIFTGKRTQLPPV